MVPCWGWGWWQQQQRDVALHVFSLLALTSFKWLLCVQKAGGKEALEAEQVSTGCGAAVCCSLGG
jgi:hypothetical protein